MLPQPLSFTLSLLISLLTTYLFPYLAFLHITTLSALHHPLCPSPPSLPFTTLSALHHPLCPSPPSLPFTTLSALHHPLCPSPPSLPFTTIFPPTLLSLPPSNSPFFLPPSFPSFFLHFFLLPPSNSPNRNMCHHLHASSRVMVSTATSWLYLMKMVLFVCMTQESHSTSHLSKVRNMVKGHSACSHNTRIMLSKYLGIWVQLFLSLFCSEEVVMSAVGCHFGNLFSRVNLCCLKACPYYKRFCTSHQQQQIPNVFLCPHWHSAEPSPHYLHGLNNWLG